VALLKELGGNIFIMDKLPFELSKYHHVRKVNDWCNRQHILFETEANFNSWYKRYIWSQNCEICLAEYKNSADRQIDHCHETLLPRAVCCRKCNARRKDKEINVNNKLGMKYIWEDTYSTCSPDINGVRKHYTFEIRRLIDGKYKRIIIRKRRSLEEIIKVRDDWVASHPQYFT